MKDNDYTTIACVALGALAVVGLGYMFSNAVVKAYDEEDAKDREFLREVMEELLRQSQTARSLLSPMRRTMIRIHLIFATNTYNLNHNTNHLVPDFTVHGARPTPDLKHVVIKTRRSECSGKVYCY